MFFKKKLNLKGDRKYLAIVFFILILLLISTVVIPLIIDSRENNWEEYLTEEINKIEQEATEIYKKKEERLLSVKSELKKELLVVLSPPNTSYRNLIRLVNEERFSDYSVEVLAPNGRVIAWNEDVALRREEIFPLEYPLGQTYFHNTELMTYLSVVDTIVLENDNFYLALSLPIEKHYKLQNPYYIPVSLTNELNENFFTQFEIFYTPFVSASKDGRKFSFELLNNYNNKIGLVEFFKPTLASEINSIKQAGENFQVFLFILLILFSALWFKGKFRKLKFRSLRVLSLLIILVLIRVLFYSFVFPARFLEGDLVDPANFSSAFAGGIVKSPIEFFVTALFFLIISVYIFQNIFSYIKEKRRKNKTISIILISSFTIIFFLSIRAIAATVKSIIFDSAIRYFKEPDLIPDLPALSMNLNLLIFSLGSFLLLCGFILLIVFYFKSFFDYGEKKNFILLLILFEIAGLIFYFLQKQPLITPFLFILITGIIFLLSYYFYIKGKNVYNFIYALLAASVVSIILMNHFNLLLERNSLRTVSYEINRPNDNLIRFYIDETLKSAVRDDRIVNAFYKKNTNYDALAFLIWSNSSLQKESLQSSVSVFNSDKKLIGSFYVGIEKPQLSDEDFNNLNEDGFRIFVPAALKENYEQVFTGLTEVKGRDSVIGYISATIVYDFNLIGNKTFPDFLESGSNILSPVVDINELRIFEFTDSKVSRVYGDIYPSRDQVEPIWETQFSPDNDAWITLTINEEEYLAYLKRTYENDEEKITAILLREKQLTWNLFNFFKLFVIHSLFILIFLFLILISRLKDFSYTFRGQLLVAFLIISIIPVIVLALYNREVVQERARTAVINELNERLNYLENHILSQKEKHPNRDLITVFANAGDELGISFGAFENTEQIFNSKAQFYNSGFFKSKLNPQAYYSLNYLSYREYLTREKIENFSFNSFYKKINVNDHSFSISVNDAFNKVDIIYSTMDMDVFLFGIYSLAVIIIIFFSAVLANRISAPIRKLTKATASVAQGDLNVILENKEKGEIKDLINGFNRMTSELQKNQIDLAELERENAWKEMAKQVAHEIKNPLTPLKLAVQQLIASYREKSDKFDSVFEKVTQTILNQIENLSSIATEFSRFAKMPSLKLEVVNLQEVIKDTINLFIEEEVKIIFNSNTDSSLIEADNNQLRRMIINLVRNSIQADADEIKIDLNSTDNNFILTFTDNGKGIPPSDRDKIFEPGFTSKEKGMGIGLKLTKRFLEGINGNIVLQETSEKGTIFRITIPQLK